MYVVHTSVDLNTLNFHEPADSAAALILNFSLNVHTSSLWKILSDLTPSGILLAHVLCLL